MKTIESDIGHVGEMHRMLGEFATDTKTPKPKPDFWLLRFTDRNFRCFYARHGRKPVGLMWGQVRDYYEEVTFEVEGFFIRRGFRGKMKAVRGLLEDSVNELKKQGIVKLSYTRPKKIIERSLINGQ